MLSAYLLCCTVALHLCVKLAGERLYGKPPIGVGAVHQHRVFCSDMTFDATVNPIVYEQGIPIFIDTERDTWNMDPVALEKAFEMYPEVKLVDFAHLAGSIIATNFGRGNPLCRLTFWYLDRLETTVFE